MDGADGSGEPLLAEGLDGNAISPVMVTELTL